jgi:hypothetical protein
MKPWRRTLEDLVSISGSRLNKETAFKDLFCLNYFAARIAAK